MQSIRENLRAKFLETYNALNAAQRKAVDTIEGPVMVIAGPGTGKTQILAARIGKILLETDTDPSNILCLTYTDAGAIAMRRRLQQFIGSDAYRVNIFTFHAFCNEVIQDNLHLFEKSSLEPISDLESIQLFKTLIDRFPKNHPLKRYRGDVYYEIRNLQQLFSTMKKEGWTPSFIRERVDAYLASLPTRDAYIYKRATKTNKPGDLKQKEIDAETERAEKLVAAVNEFDNLQQLMRERNRYDFDDMINWVIRVFEENPAVLSTYQEKYQYILVDEFQDTSGTQNRIVELLISYWDEPNVFVVGDDDQSIFRFQGANIENMLNFHKSYADTLETIVLTDNYRSIQPILDVSKTLISRNRDRLINSLSGLSKDLMAANSTINHLKHPPVIKACLTPAHEMAHITLEVERLLSEGVKPGKIAVIYRENKYGEELAGYLRLKKIPYYTKRSVNLLSQPFIKKAVTLLRYLDAEHDVPYGGEEMLFEIMHFDFYSIHPIEIAKLTVQANNLRYNGEQASIRKLLAELATKPPADLFDKGPDEKLVNFSKMIESLIADVSNLTLQQLFELLIRKAGILSYIMNSSDKIALMQMLTAFFNFIKEETARDPYLGLSGFMEIIDLMEKEGIALPLVEVCGNDLAVNLLTAHGSKGLEFSHVFFAGLNAHLWEKKRKPIGGYKLPDTLFNAASDAEGEEELRRLFYVALTRAEKNLTLSFTQFRKDGKEAEPSQFLAEVQDEHSFPVEKIEVSESDMFEFDQLQFNALAPEIERAEEDFITMQLSKFVMNVTALNNYLDCPLGFYYKNLVRIPSGKNEAAEFGSAVHYAVEKLFTRMKENGDRFPDKEVVIEDFKWYMNRHRENFTREAFNRRMEYGEETLNNYYETYIDQWNNIVLVERNIRNVVVDGVPLKGKLDKLEFTGKEVNVVDYKTGNVDNAKAKLEPPNDKQPNGGDYWRQAVFYKLLVENAAQKDWTVVSTEFDFVEPDKNKKYQKRKIVISPADTETVRHQVVSTWEKIQNREFYTGCGKEDCHWCNFIKDNNLAVALHEMEEAEEE